MCVVKNICNIQISSMIHKTRRTYARGGAYMRGGLIRGATDGGRPLLAESPIHMNFRSESNDVGFMYVLGTYLE